MITEKQIEKAVIDLFADIKFPTAPQGLYDPLRYMISIGGKRIRPRLCLMSYSLFKKYLSDEILQPAAALEVFHTFTLIHDDIMDRSDMRRGMPTVWKKWDEVTAILSGDVMQVDSFKRVAKAPHFVLDRALELFSTTAAQIMEGQQYDMDFEQIERVPMADYLKMIGLKTAVLIACSAKMGALIAGADDEDCDALYDYGYKLGLAFQIADDYLDCYGDEKVFGKPIGGDIVNNKKSWLMIRAQEKTSDAADLSEKMSMPVDTAEQRQEKIKTVRAIYDALDIAADAKAEIKKLTDEAMAALDNMELSPEKEEMLCNFADKLVGRAK